MNRVARLLSLVCLLPLAFGVAGCRESDELPVENSKAYSITDVPSEDPTYEEALSYAVNLGPRAGTKPREIAGDALDKVEKKVKDAKPVDQKKLDQIKACRERISALADYLRDHAFFAKYVNTKTYPGVTFEDIEAKLAKAGDKEYIKLKALDDAAKKKNEDAYQKMLDIAGEFKTKEG
jgi:hypothetical protein